jgi:hypothetical protein
MTSSVVYTQISPHGPQSGRDALYLNQSAQRNIQVHSPPNQHSRHEHESSSRPRHNAPPEPNGISSSSYNHASANPPRASDQASRRAADDHHHDQSLRSTLSRLVEHAASQILPPIIYYSDGSHSQRRLQAPEFDRGFKWSNCTGRKRALCVCPLDP